MIEAEQSSTAIEDRPLYAVMGNPIAHSLSPVIHQYFSEQTGRPLRYEKIEVPLARFERAVVEFFNQGGAGLNVTLPFKERAFAMAEKRSSRCEQAGAANTLWMDHGVLNADNTDGVGLVRDLSRHIDLANKTLLLLGAGGAARGVIGELLQAHPAQLILSNRTIEKAHVLQKIFPGILSCGFDELTGSYDVIINATSASFSNTPLQLPPAIVTHHPFCYDLAYSNKDLTPFVHWAKSQGCPAVDGIGMLIEQAAESFFIWHGIRPNAKIPLLSLNQV